MNSIEHIEKACRWFAIPVALISAWFTYKFAASTMTDPWLGSLLGIALAMCALGSGYLWTLRQTAMRSGIDAKTAKMMLAACVMFTSVDAFTNAGSILWQRQAADNSASFQNTKATDARNAVLQGEERVEFFKKRIADLKEANPWVTTVSAEGLKAQAANLEGDRIYKRSKECANVTLKESRDFCDKLANLRDQIAKAEKLGDHEKQLAASMAGLDRARAAAAEAPTVVSATNSQALSLASLGSVFFLSPTLKPSEDAQEWTGYITGLVLAIFLTFGPMAFNWFGFGLWRQGTVKSAQPAPVAMTETRAKIEDRYEEIRAGDSPKNANYFVKVGNTEDALAKLADILRKSNMRTA